MQRISLRHNMGSMSRPIKFRAWNGTEMTTDFVLRADGTTNRDTAHYDFCQYTGLKDKNGVEIYEGDIIEGEDRIVEVYWNEIGIWDCNWIKYTQKMPSTKGLPKYQWKYSEVIGNIYENPELLK